LGIQHPFPVTLFNAAGGLAQGLGEGDKALAVGR